MTENVRKFEKALRESWELQRRLVEELKKIAGERSASNDAEAMAKAAQALGYDFTVADMEKAHAETQELDSGEMEQAAGGWCFADYDCYTAWNHDSPDQPGSACFSDYDCITLFHDSKVDELIKKAEEFLNSEDMKRTQKDGKGLVDYIYKKLPLD
jgi:predicted ribosomally synthesized peptide with nif11-like leader